MARILIVDDEPDVRELFNITLKMAGHTTDTAKHGLEAVDKLAGDMPELIVLDLMMPHLDGFGLLAHIRNKLAAKPIRVLIATAKVLEETDQVKLGSWPVVGVLNKGELDIGQMVMIVSTALARNPMKDGEPPVQPAKDGEPPVQPAKSGEPPALPAKDGEPPVQPAKGGEPPALPAKDGEPPAKA